MFVVWFSGVFIVLILLLFIMALLLKFFVEKFKYLSISDKFTSVLLFLFFVVLFLVLIGFL